MNKYKVTKIVFAEEAGEADKLVTGGKTQFVELVEEDINTNNIGFNNKGDDER